MRIVCPDTLTQHPEDVFEFTSLGGGATSDAVGTCGRRSLLNPGRESVTGSLNFLRTRLCVLMMSLFISFSNMRKNACEWTDGVNQSSEDRQPPGGPFYTSTSPSTSHDIKLNSSSNHHHSSVARGPPRPAAPCFCVHPVLSVGYHAEDTRKDGTSAFQRVAASRRQGETCSMEL